MLQKALQKLQAEATAADKDDEYTPFIASHLMTHIRNNPEDAVLILADEKTIKGSLDHMRDLASKKQKNNQYAVTPDQGKAIILQYFGIAANEPPAAPITANFNTSLDDLF